MGKDTDSLASSFPSTVGYSSQTLSHVTLAKYQAAKVLLQEAVSANVEQSGIFNMLDYWQTLGSTAGVAAIRKGRHPPQPAKKARRLPRRLCSATREITGEVELRKRW